MDITGVDKDWPPETSSHSHTKKNDSRKHQTWIVTVVEAWLVRLDKFKKGTVLTEVPPVKDEKREITEV